MRFTSKLWIAALAITGMFFTSCQKDENAPVQTDVAKVEAPQEKPSIDALRAAYPTIEKGRLHFKSQADFKTYMGLIGKYDIDAVNALNQEKGFVSHFAKTHQDEDGMNSANAKGDDREESAKWAIPDSYFAETLNENREISFADGGVCRAGNDFSFAFPNGEEGLIDKFYQDYARGGVKVADEGTVIGELFVYPTGLEAPNVGGTKVRNIFEKRIRDSRTFDGSSFRLYGEMWQGNWIVYASSGVTSECNRTRTFLWTTYYSYTSASKLGISWNGILAAGPDANCNPGPLAFITNPIGALNKVNSSTVIERFEWVTGEYNFFFPLKSKPAKLLNKIVTGSKSTHTGTLNRSSKSFSLVWKC